MDQRTILCRNCQQARDHDGIVCRHLFLILLHTALDFVNGMIADDTNPKEELTKWVELRLDLVSPWKWSPLHRADCVELRTSSWIPLCVCVFHTHASR